MKKMCKGTKTFFFCLSFIHSFLVSWQQGSSLVTYISLWGSWNLIYVFPPPAFLLSPSSPSMSESSLLPSVWSHVSADPQQIVYFARYRGNMDGPLHWLKIYCWDPARLQCDVYLKQGPLLQQAWYRFHQWHITKDNGIVGLWATMISVDTWYCACKYSTQPTNCRYWGHRSFNKPHTPMSYNWLNLNPPTSDPFKCLLQGKLDDAGRTPTPRRSLVVKFMRPLCITDVLL